MIKTSPLHVRFDAAQKDAVMAAGGSTWAREVLAAALLLDLSPAVWQRIITAETPLARRLLSEALEAVAP